MSRRETRDETNVSENGATVYFDVVGHFAEAVVRVNAVKCSRKKLEVFVRCIRFGGPYNCARALLG